MQIPLHRFGNGLSAVEALDVSHMSNDELTATTIFRMHSLATRDATHPYVLDTASYIRQTASDPSQHEILQATFRHVKATIKYVDDSKLVLGWWKKGLSEALDCEVLVSPARLITMPRPMGDCDDFAMLGMSLLQAQGIHSQFCTIKGNPYDPQEWSHVYLKVWDAERDQWLGFDGSHGKYVGWESEYAFERKVWSL